MMSWGLISSTIMNYAPILMKHLSKKVNFDTEIHFMKICHIALVSRLFHLITYFEKFQKC